MQDAVYMNALRGIFQGTSVVFIGYGLGDDYIIKNLQRSAELKVVFGDGPHFACLPEARLGLPSSVKFIRYVAEPHRDHRDAIQLIEEVALHSKPSDSKIKENQSTSRTLASAHMLSDIYPAGTWVSGQRIVARSDDGSKEIVFHHGHGLTQGELPLTVSTAMHDIAVGLLCFDHIYAPLSALGRTFQLLGEPLLTELIRTDVLRFVRLRRSEAIIFPADQPEITGGLGTITLPEYDSGGRELTVRDLIIKQLQPLPGLEKQAEELFCLLGENVVDPTPNEPALVPAMVRSLLLRPSVRSMLGISGGVSVAAIPRWVMYPVLRMAYVVRLGIVCRELQLASIKFEFGSDRLAGPAFSSAFGEENAERLASYILAGNFSTDLGAFINCHPEIVPAIVRFRDTSEGQRFRSEILYSLTVSAGSDVAASINAGLSRIIPSSVLESARANFAGLCLADEARKYPAMWQDVNFGANALRLWKERSAVEFQRLCRERGCSPYDHCLCGSGEKAKFCCGEALGAAWS